MQRLIRELIPHAPQMGLYVHPDIPAQLLKNALRDYATSMTDDEVLALYDATRIGNAKDGAVFGARRFVFQNHDFASTHTVRYVDLIGVEKKRGLLRGAKVALSVNRGRATFELEMDCSGRPEAQEYLHRFLHEAMHYTIVEEEGGVAGDTSSAAKTDLAAVRGALDDLQRRGLLTEADHARLLAVLRP